MVYQKLLKLLSFVLLISRVTAVILSTSPTSPTSLLSDPIYLDATRVSAPPSFATAGELRKRQGLGRSTSICGYGNGDYWRCPPGYVCSATVLPPNSKYYVKCVNDNAVNQYYLFTTAADTWTGNTCPSYTLCCARPTPDFVVELFTSGDTTITGYECNTYFDTHIRSAATNLLEPVTAVSASVTSSDSSSTSSSSSSTSQSTPDTVPSSKASDSASSSKTSSSDSGLSSGAKIGIGVGVGVGVGILLLAGLFFFFWRKNQKKKEQQPVSETAPSKSVDSPQSPYSPQSQYNPEMAYHYQQEAPVSPVDQRNSASYPVEAGAGEPRELQGQGKFELDSPTAELGSWK